MIRRAWFVCVVAPAMGAGLLLSQQGCGDDEIFAEAPDAAFDASAVGPEAGPTTPPAGQDAGAPSGCVPSAGAPQRLLLTMTSVGPGQAESELAVINLGTHAVDGRLGYASPFGTTSAANADPFLLAQRTDLVVRLDSKEPWEAVSSWSVAGDDAVDGGPDYAEPAAVAVPACGKGYVVRFNRNQIAVIDTSQIADAGAPVKWIDLSPLVQASDSDGRVDMTGALWVAAHKRLYVLLGNVDINRIATDGFTALCDVTRPSIVGIDVDTDEIVSLGGAGPGGSSLLDGDNPVLGSGFVYDAALDRFLVLEGGCNAEVGDGGAGPIERRGIEEVSLATRQAKTLVTIPGQYFPLGLAYGDGSRAIVSTADQFSFEGKAFFWDPRSDALGPEVPGRIDGVAFAGGDRFVGARAATVDGGPGIEVVSFSAADGGIDAGAVETIAQDPFTDNGGFLGGVEVWPR
jgi:hypothetical protein